MFYLFSVYISICYVRQYNLKQNSLLLKFVIPESLVIQQKIVK